MKASPGRLAGRTVRIGLTGPIGCGKSTIASWLHGYGAATIDADVIARDVVEPGTPELAAVVEAFGNEMLRSDGSLDRDRLGRLVFADPAALDRLEAIVHPGARPRILAAIGKAERARKPAIVVEAIKLVEGGLAELCDEVWLVDCDPEAQRDRLAARGLKVDQAGARITAQAPSRAGWRRAATRVIDTTGSLDESRERVREAWEATVR